MLQGIFNKIYGSLSKKSHHDHGKEAEDHCTLGYEESLQEFTTFNGNWKLHFRETFKMGLPGSEDMENSIVGDIIILGNSTEQAILKHVPSNRKLDLKKDQISTIQSLLIEMRLLEGKTSITGNVDSSICEGGMVLEGYLTNGDGIVTSFNFHLWFMHSGFHGEDGDTLSRLLTYFETLLPDVDLYKLLNYR